MDEWLAEHLEEMKRRFLVVVLSVAAISIFAFSFGFSLQDFSGLQIPVPEPTIDDSIATMLFKRIEEDLVPPGVDLIVTRPADALFLQLGMSFFVGVVASMPVIIYQVAMFVAPALTERERRTIIKVLASWFPLFITGAVFSYAVVVPMMLQFLYGYVFSLHVLPLLNINDFVSFVTQIVVAFGLIFTLPAFMAMLAAVGVDPSVWRRNWRYALGGMVIFGAIITPDGSLVTLGLVAGPMAALYAAGYLVSRAVYRGRSEERFKSVG